MRRHPAIERSPLGKEVHYFDRFWQGNAPDDIAAEYASCFHARPARSSGEWTPRYLADFWTVPLIRKAAPDARILVMFRDPVARYRSAIARLHRLAEERGIRGPAGVGQRRDLARLLLPAAPPRVRASSRVNRFWCSSSSAASQDPMAEMERTWRFLGLEPPRSAPGPPAEAQAGRPQRSRSSSSQVARGTRRALPGRRLRLAELCPEIDLSLWTSVAGENELASDQSGRWCAVELSRPWLTATCGW